MAKIVFQARHPQDQQHPSLLTQPSSNLERRIYQRQRGEQPQQPPLFSPEELSVVSRIVTHLDRALGLILDDATTGLQTQQQQLIGLLIDVLQQQPDLVLLDLIIQVLQRHGIGACHFIPLSPSPVSTQQQQYTRQQREATATLVHECYHSPKKDELCLVRLGPLVLRLRNDSGYSEMLRGARDLCQLKHARALQPF